jgi:glycosyltransferase involved in cell wall biosynthesis
VSGEAPASVVRDGHQLYAEGPPPRVSVVMPVHNGLPYLPLALDSILAQSFRDFEFTIVDDASTDGTAEVLAEYARRDRRIRVLTNSRNVGVAAALNIGLDAARGELIARMDADDIARPERLRRQVEFLDGCPDHVLVGTSCSFIDGSGRATVRDVYWRQVEHWELEWITLFFTAVLHPTAMFRAPPRRRKTIRYDEQYRHAEDLDFFAQLLDEGKGAILREPLLDVRRVPTGVTERFFAEQKREACDLLLRRLIRRYPDLQPQVATLEPVIGMLQRQGLPADRSLPAVFDAMILLEQRFLRDHRLLPKQQRRIHCLTAFWLLWGVFQAGRLKPSGEALSFFWRGRGYWWMFVIEAGSIAMRHAASAVRRPAR